METILAALLWLQVFKVPFGELTESEIVAEAAGGVAGAALLAQHAEAGSQMAHHLREGGYDLAALRIVAAHAAEPQAIFLRAVEDGELLFRDKFVALGGGEAERVAVALQVQEELGAVVVFPLAGVDCAAAQADDHRQVLHADGALKLARAAGGALESGFLRKEFPEQRLFACRAEFV